MVEVAQDDVHALAHLSESVSDGNTDFLVGDICSACSGSVGGLDGPSGEVLAARYEDDSVSALET